MKLYNYIKPDFINLDIKAKDKKGVIEELAAPLSEYAGIERDELVKTLLERERLGSTGIGKGIAIPHGKVKNLKELMIGFGLSPDGVNFDSIDNKPVFIFFVIITPDNSTGDHLRVLAKISRLLRENEIREEIIRVSDKEEVLKLIEDNDTND
ncbi:MAG: PTS fructose transporter subunit IIA [Deltaproteobacteria bacterium]|nr:MAG: PTS fructose transporter subunit IIA [Deltaproteobacteria bacterium]PIE74942.1 MAG: PTS fructose transporter subunit IIA [Deltaproteobacteria bacterium]